MTELRDLHERRELEANTGYEKELLLKEVNHRVKNSLQIVASILHLKIRRETEAAAAIRSATARIMAIAAVHERLYTGTALR